MVKGALIQARMGSTRMPGKIVLPLAGKPILLRVIDRLRLASSVDMVAVATSIDPSDDSVVSACRQWGVDCYRGSLHDVLDRYLQACRCFGLDLVVRITADCPLTDPALVDEVVQALVAADGYDFASNNLVRRYPRGTDVAAMTVAALERSWIEASQPYERVHVTPYIKEHPERFRLLSIEGNDDCGHHRWTVDTLDDYRLMEAIFARLTDLDHYSWRDVVAILQREPQLMAINRHVQQKRIEDL